MSSKRKFHKKIEALIQYLQNFTDRKWYPPLVGFLALIDYFIIVIPTDGILISSTILKPKNWLYLSFCVTLGSTVGALILFHLVESHGLSWILDMYPNIIEGKLWQWTDLFFKKYGLLLVFFVAATPLMQQPVIVLAAISHTSFVHILSVIFAGRLIKYLLLSYISSHSPHLLSKLWGVKGELDDVGIHINGKIHKPE